jgi:hypothetical protein
MPRIYRDVDALAGALRDRFAGAAIIGIDGWTGVGKTTLAQALVSKLGGSFYDLDAALIRDQKRYVSALRGDEIQRALHECRGVLFVSGICLRQVLEGIGSHADAHIYVKRMATWGWADEDELSGRSIPEIPGASGEKVREELRLYHEVYEPQAIADYEFQRPS